MSENLETIKDQITVSYGMDITQGFKGRIPFEKIVEFIKSEQLAKNINTIRAIADDKERKEAKKLLPFIGLSYFTDNIRKKESFEMAIGMILDVDGLTQEQMRQLYPKIREDDTVYCAFTSPSGKGLKIVYLFDKPIMTETQYKWVYKKYAAAFKLKYGVEPDPNCADITRTCFLSYYPDIFFNPDCERLNTYSLLIDYVKPEPPIPSISGTETADNDKVTKAVDILVQKPDMYRDYGTWQKLGLALASLGEQGRQHFIKLTEANHYHNDNENYADREFDRLLKVYKDNGNGVGIGTLFHIAGEIGTTLSAPKKTGGKLELMKLSEFLKKPKKEAVWQVERLLISSGTSALVSDPKTGKSTLARYLAVCVARGAPFLGKNTRQGSVIFLMFEGTEYEAYENFVKLGVTEEDPIHFYVGNSFNDANNKLQNSLQDFREKGEYISLVIIDSMFKFGQIDNIDKYNDTTAFFNNIIALAREYDCHICCTHHKNKNRDFNSVRGVLGSIGIAGAVDAIITLEKDKNGARTINTDLRFGDPISGTLHFDPDTQTFSLDGCTEDDKTPADTLQEQITDIIRKNPYITEKMLDEKVRGKKKSKVDALTVIFNSGRVERTGGGVKNDPYMYRIKICESYDIRSCHYTAKEDPVSIILSVLDSEDF